MSWHERKQANNTHPSSSGWRMDGRERWSPEDVSIVTNSGIDLMAGKVITTSKRNMRILSSPFGNESLSHWVLTQKSPKCHINILYGWGCKCCLFRRVSQEESQASHTQISTYPKSTKHLRKPITPLSCTTPTQSLWSVQKIVTRIDLLWWKEENKGNSRKQHNIVRPFSFVRPRPRWGR